MKTTVFILFSIILFSLTGKTAHAQCEIKHRLYPDGSMYYYINPVNFYWTKVKELKGGVVTDKEEFYIALQPHPFPEKPKGNKINGDLEIKLSNDSVYQLKHFDTRYIEHDSIMQLLYLIDKKSQDEFQKFEVISVKIDMKGTEGIRTYVFKLHKSAIKEQLQCFLKEDEDKNKK